jgi:pyruvate,water dikinase
MIYASGDSQDVKNVETSKKERRSFVLDDDEIIRLAEWAVKIESHYGKPMDIEWAKDGETGELFIVQARPETVQSQKEAAVLKTFKLKEKGNKIVRGISIGQAIASGKALIIDDPDDIDRFKEDAILVTGMTDPD